jgi:hypothetical protein
VIRNEEELSLGVTVEIVEIILSIKVVSELNLNYVSGS